MDQVHLAIQLQKLAKLLGKSLTEVHRDQFRLNVEMAIRLTAPFSPGQSFTESLSKQRRLGQARTVSDIRGDRVTKARGIFTDDPERKGKDGKDSVAWKVSQMVARGQIEQANLFLARIGLAQKMEALQAPTREAHKSQRGRDGRRRRGAKQFIVPRGSADRYAKDRSKKVGLTKAGWAPAAVALGSKGRNLPKWILSQASMGTLEERGVGTPKEALTAVNSVPWVAQPIAHNRIASMVAKARRHNMRRQIEMTQKGLARKWSKRARTRN
jgi:hypothetical protein